MDWYAARSRTSARHMNHHLWRWLSCCFQFEQFQIHFFAPIVENVWLVCTTAHAFEIRNAVQGIFFDNFGQRRRRDSMQYKGDTKLNWKRSKGMRTGVDSSSTSSRQHTSIQFWPQLLKMELPSFGRYGLGIWMRSTFKRGDDPPFAIAQMEVTAALHN